MKKREEKGGKGREGRERKKRGGTRSSNATEKRGGRGYLGFKCYTKGRDVKIELQITVVGVDLCISTFIFIYIFKHSKQILYGL